MNKTEQAPKLKAEARTKRRKHPSLAKLRWRQQKIKGRVNWHKSDYAQFMRRNCANFLTFLNVVCGSFSILLGINGHFLWAIAFIGFASVADRYDGVLARKFGTSSQLGVELDSLGDSISFGVAPALLIYLRLVKPLAPSPGRFLMSLAVVFYISCGIFRLARYNVHGLNEGAFEGIPITIAGMILAFLMLLHNAVNVYVYGSLLLLFGLLMISKFKLRKR